MMSLSIFKRRYTGFDSTSQNAPSGFCTTFISGISMNRFVILRDKRAEIAGRIAALKKQIARHKTELAKLDGVISLFDPAYQVGDIPAKRAKERSNLFTHGELGRLILDALRKAGEPLPTAAIVAYIAGGYRATRRR